MTPKYIIVHHAGGTDANPLQDSSNYTFDMCNEDHRLRDFPKSSFGFYVGYQYFIDKSGTVRQARTDIEEGAHCNQVMGGVSLNRQSIGICMAGNFDATLPTPAQKTALTTLLKSKMTQWAIPIENIVPHRRFAPKTCYGRNLPDDWAQKLVIPAVDIISPLRNKLNAQLDAKDYKGAKDTTSFLFTELSKL